VVDPRAQVVTAASAGSVAGIAMTGWLLDRDMTAAVSAARPIGGGAR
jgi:thioredoxin reductase (NADPH)